MLHTFLIRFSSAGYLSTFCLWFWQFHWLRFFAQTSAVCTVKKHHILYVMIGFEARCFTAKSGRFVPIAFIPTEVTVHWRTYMSTWAKRAWIWVTGWFLRCSNTYLYKCTCEAPDKVSRPGSYQWHVSTYMHSLHPQNASFMIFNQPTGLRPLSTNQVRCLFFFFHDDHTMEIIHPDGDGSKLGYGYAKYCVMWISINVVDWLVGGPPPPPLKQF